MLLLVQTPLWFMVSISIMSLGRSFNFWSCCCSLQPGCSCSCNIEISLSSRVWCQTEDYHYTDGSWNYTGASRNSYWSQKDRGTTKQERIFRNAVESPNERGLSVCICPQMRVQIITMDTWSQTMWLLIVSVNFWWPLFTDGAEAGFQQPGAI